VKPGGYADEDERAGRSSFSAAAEARTGGGCSVGEGCLAMHAIMLVLQQQVGGGRRLQIRPVYPTSRHVRRGVGATRVARERAQMLSVRFSGP
jgi:hypothetical protein